MNLIIIDDDPLVVNSLKTIISDSGIEVLATGHNGLDAIELYKNHRPDLILMDIRMEKMNGIDAAKQIISIDEKASILLITTFQDDEYIASALSIGCKGYILKQNIAGILPAVNAVFAGNMVFDSKIVSNIKTHPKRIPISNLSERELDILNLIAEGFNNKEIAEKLYLGEGTVRNYISNMLDKLDLRDRTQLAIYYYKHKYGVDY